MNIQELLTSNRRHLWHPFTQMAHHFQDDPLIIERGEGMKLVDIQGRSYYDGTASMWLNVWGHSCPPLQEAILTQLTEVAHTTLLGAAHPPAIRLAEQLVRWTPARLQKVFFSDSGAAAIEVGLKMATLYWRHRGKPAKETLVTFTQAYHGDTLGAMSVGRIPLYHQSFASLGFPTYAVPYPYPYRFPGTTEECKAAVLEQLDVLLQQHAPSIAGVIVEPMVQGAGGMVCMPPGFLRALADLCQAHQVFLLLDEVATGFGRTGLMFACEHEGVEPDILMLGKQLTGGMLPVSATLASDDIYDAFYDEHEVPSTKTLYHGHSYAGNPLGCAAALANLALYEQKQLLRHVQTAAKEGAKALQPLQDHPHVGEIRQCGLAIGIELVADRVTKESFPPAQQIAAQVCAVARRRGLLLRPLGGGVVPFIPPLAVSMTELEEMMAILVAAIEEGTACPQSSVSNS